METCSAIGLMVKTTTNKCRGKCCCGPNCQCFLYNHVPLSIFPMPFPADIWHDAAIKQQDISELIASLIAKPLAYIHGTLDSFSKFDKFMARLMEVSSKFNAQLVRQDTHMCILRSDYMLDSVQKCIKLVEYNTIAVAFTSLALRTRQVQDYVVNKYGPEFVFNYTEVQGYSPEVSQLQDRSTNHRHLINNFRDAVEYYRESMQLASNR